MAPASRRPGRAGGEPSASTAATAASCGEPRRLLRAPSNRLAPLNASLGPRRSAAPAVTSEGDPWSEHRCLFGQSFRWVIGRARRASAHAFGAPSPTLGSCRLDLGLPPRASVISGFEEQYALRDRHDIAAPLNP